jgi:hypothetical protein
MQELGFSRDDTNNYQVLCLGAHSDDIEIGCGGTLLSWLPTRGMSSFTGSSLAQITRDDKKPMIVHRILSERDQ